MLFEDTWEEHIIEDRGHGELAEHLDAVLGTVLVPDHRASDPWHHREQFYKQDVGPSRWLKVVVCFEDKTWHTTDWMEHHHETRQWARHRRTHLRWR